MFFLNPRCLCHSKWNDGGKDKDFFSIGVELPLKNSPSTMVRIVERQEQLDSFLAEFPRNLVKEHVVGDKVPMKHKPFAPGAVDELDLDDVLDVSECDVQHTGHFQRKGAFARCNRKVAV